uniref:Uncharacterized protein n=1 Tax=Acrobeloides nanus TaxID=290746 RepID=A0A914C645_9BILA
MQFIPYDLISFHIENIQASFNLQFYGVFGPFEVPGNIYAQLNDLSIYIKLKTIPSKLYPNAIALLNCATSLNNARYTFEPSSSYAWAGWMKTFEQSQMRMLESEADYAIRNNIGLIICNGLQEQIQSFLNVQKISFENLKEPLNQNSINIKHFLWNDIILPIQYQNI